MTFTPDTTTGGAQYSVSISPNGIPPSALETAEGFSGAIVQSALSSLPVTAEGAPAAVAAQYRENRLASGWQDRPELSWETDNFTFITMQRDGIAEYVLIEPNGENSTMLIIDGEPVCGPTFDPPPLN